MASFDEVPTDHGPARLDLGRQIAAALGPEDIAAANAEVTAFPDRAGGMTGTTPPAGAV